MDELAFIDQQIAVIRQKILDNTGLESFSVSTGHGSHSEKIESNDTLQRRLDDLLFRKSQLAGEGIISVSTGGW